MLLALVLLASIEAAALLHRIPTARVRRPHMSGAAGSASGGGGDLEGGSNDERNAQLASLRNMWAAPVDTPDSETKRSDDAQRLGIMLDLPLCRFSWCLLPHQPMTLNIWQPQYTLMLGSLLSGTGPHYYLHVLLPGGAESLGQPGYELRPGTKASLTGTLMRIVYAQREGDQRLTIVVQGLARGVVLNATQDLPYSRADVQILPDGEVLRAAARSSTRLLRQIPKLDAKATAESDVPPSVLRRMVVAAAAAEARAWIEYEALPLSMDSAGSVSSVNQLNAEGFVEASENAEKSVREALNEVPMPADVAADTLYDFEGSFVLEATRTALQTDGETEAEETEAESAEAEALALLEVQLWVELDDLLTKLRSLATANPQSVPTPAYMLGMLPPPPATGWPLSFKLQAIADLLRVEYEAELGKPVVGLRKQSYVPMDERYPASRRAERLSWVVWEMIGDQRIGVNSMEATPYQALIEAEGTAERLRLALLKTREIKERLRNMDSYT